MTLAALIIVVLVVLVVQLINTVILLDVRQSVGYLNRELGVTEKFDNGDTE